MSVERGEPGQGTAGRRGLHRRDPGSGASERWRETRSCPHRWCAPTAESPVPVPLAGEDRFPRWTSVAMPAPLSAATGLSLRNGIPKQRSRTNGLRCPLPHAGPCPWPGLRRVSVAHILCVQTRARRHCATQRPVPAGSSSAWHLVCSEQASPQWRGTPPPGRTPGEVPAWSECRPSLSLLSCPARCMSAPPGWQERVGWGPNLTTSFSIPATCGSGGATFRIDREVCLDPPKQLAPQHGRPRSSGQVCPRCAGSPRSPARISAPFCHADLRFQQGADE